MTDETVTIPKFTAQIVFDALCTSMDFGSGFLDTEEVEALRGLAVALGVDPNVGTPDEFKAGYPHPFDAPADREGIAHLVDALERHTSWDGLKWDTTFTIDESKMPAHVPCKVGPYGRKCLKAEDDPIHIPAALAAQNDTEAS